MANSQIPYFKTWLIYTLSSMVLGALCGMASGMVCGFVMGAAGMPVETIKIVCGIVGFVLGIIVSFIMFRWAVDKFIVLEVSRLPSTALAE